jgi:peptide methionine sulfoxide reductase MsrB
MAALTESRPTTNDCAVTLDGIVAHLQTLSILYCSSCRQVRVAGWPDWKIENGKLVSGTFPTEWEMEWINCRWCESKSHLKEVYELEPKSADTEVDSKY